MTTQEKIQEIQNTLEAYKNGWIGLSEEAIRRMVQEIVELQKTQD